MNEKLHPSALVAFGTVIATNIVTINAVLSVLLSMAGLIAATPGVWHGIQFIIRKIKGRREENKNREDKTL